MPAFGKPWDSQDIASYVFICFPCWQTFSRNFWFSIFQQCITSCGHKEDQGVPERSSGHHMDCPQSAIHPVWCKFTRGHTPVIKAHRFIIFIVPQPRVRQDLFRGQRLHSTKSTDCLHIIILEQHSLYIITDLSELAFSFYSLTMTSCCPPSHTESRLHIHWPVTMQTMCKGRLWIFLKSVLLPAILNSDQRTLQFYWSL